jgi:transglutaminase-like putative cysteine protease
MPGFSFKMPLPPKITKFFLIAGICAVAAFAVLPPCAHASNSAPDWLSAAAQEKLPTYPNAPVAVVLLDESQTTVNANGEISTRHRVAYKLLRPEAEDRYGYVGVPFDGETKILSFKAWTITADGRVLALSEKDAIETSDSTYEVFTDDRMKIMKFSDAVPGSVVGYEYTQKERPFIFENDWWFQRGIPVRRARLTLQLPPAWDYSANWFNYAEQKPETSGAGQYVWEVDDVPAIDAEPDMPPQEAVEGWVGLKFYPQDPSLRAKTTGTWKDLGVWYNGLTQESRVASPAIQQEVTTLTAGMTNPVDKIRAIARYVRRQIRYAAIEVGIGGYQPHPAADVFTHQYGDCKDKATLLSSMLHQIGIDSYYVIIDSERGVVQPTYPSMNFDHVILAVKLPDSVDDPTLYSVVNDPALGRLLFVDPTDEYTPLGYLPSELQDSYGLVVAPDGGHLIKLPLLPPSTNRLIRIGKFSLSPGGDLSGDIQQIQWGGPAEDYRYQFLSTQPSNRANIFESFLGSFLTNFTLTQASLGNLDQYNQNLMMNYKFVAASYATVAGNMLFVRPRIVGDKYTGLLSLFSQDKPRQYPVAFEEATLQSDMFDITLPPGYVPDGLPRPVTASCDYASYHSTTTVADGVLHYQRTFEIKSVIVPKNNLPQIRAFLQQVAADQSATAVLRKVSP